MASKEYETYIILISLSLASSTGNGTTSLTTSSNDGDECFNPTKRCWNAHIASCEQPWDGSNETTTKSGYTCLNWNIPNYINARYARRGWNHNRCMITDLEGFGGDTPAAPFCFTDESTDGWEECFNSCSESTAIDDDELSELFFFAIHSNNVDEAERLLIAGAKPNRRRPHGQFPMQIARAQGWVALMEVIIKYGGDVNAEEGEVSLLSKAISEINTNPKQDKIARLLIENGADVNAVESDNFSPLHMAISGELTEMSLLLIKKGANVNTNHINVNGGGTPLHFAVRYGLMEVCKALLSNGSRVNVVEKSFGYTPLHNAARYDRPAIAELLIRHGADPNFAPNDNWTPLLSAAQLDTDKVARVLLANGADPEKGKISNGRTALHLTSESNNVKTMEVILQYNASLARKDKHGYTSLHIATWSASLEAITLLLEYGSDTEAVDFKGNTPLHIAAEDDIGNATRLLRLGGALISATNHDGHTPVYVALSRGNRDAAVWLTLQLEEGRYVDCFKWDQGTYLESTLEATLSFSIPDTCIRHCSELTFNYAAIGPKSATGHMINMTESQQSLLCICFPSTTEWVSSHGGSSDACWNPCPGNTELECGGVASVSVYAAGDPPQLRCPDDSWRLRDHYCYKRFSEKRHFGDADGICGSHGGHLVSIMSRNESRFLERIATKAILEKDAIWIGLTDKVMDREYEWTDSGMLRYNSFPSYRLPYSMNRDCVAIYGNPDGGGLSWHLADCFEKHGFICKVLAWRKDEQRQSTCRMSTSNRTKDAIIGATVPVGIILILLICACSIGCALRKFDAQSHPSRVGRLTKSFLQSLRLRDTWSIKKVVKDDVDMFCRETSIGGLRELVLAQTRVSRSLWLVLFLALLLVMMYQTYILTRDYANGETTTDVYAITDAKTDQMFSKGLICARAYGGWAKAKASSHATLTAAGPTPQAVDAHPQCCNWARRGECVINKSWMLTNCQRSCTSSSKSAECTTMPCKLDSTGSCAKWAAAGECSKNSFWMLANCQTSCNTCGIARNSDLWYNSNEGQRNYVAGYYSGMKAFSMASHGDHDSWLKQDMTKTGANTTSEFYSLVWGIEPLIGTVFRSPPFLASGNREGGPLMCRVVESMACSDEKGCPIGFRINIDWDVFLRSVGSYKTFNLYYSPYYSEDISVAQAILESRKGLFTLRPHQVIKANRRVIFVRLSGYTKTRFVSFLYYTRLQLYATKYIFANKAKDPCSDTPTTGILPHWLRPRTCNCEEEFARKYYNCSHSALWDRASAKIYRPCDRWAKRPSSRQRDSMDCWRENCKSRCKRIKYCTGWSLQLSVLSSIRDYKATNTPSLFPEIEDWNYTQYMLSTTPPDEIVAIEEKFMTTWEEFLSEIGGLWGLYMGCSILSFAHIGWFIGDAVFARKKRHSHLRRMIKREMRDMIESLKDEDKLLTEAYRPSANPTPSSGNRSPASPRSRGRSPSPAVSERSPSPTSTLRSPSPTGTMWSPSLTSAGEPDQPAPDTKITDSSPSARSESVKDMNDLLETV